MMCEAELLERSRANKAKNDKEVSILSVPMRGFFHLTFKPPDRWKACATGLECQPLSTKSGSRQYEHSFSLLSYFFS